RRAALGAMNGPVRRERGVQAVFHRLAVAEGAPRVLFRDPVEGLSGRRVVLDGEGVLTARALQFHLHDEPPVTWHRCSCCASEVPIMQFMPILTPIGAEVPTGPMFRIEL